MKGRKPTPTARRKLQGNPQRRPYNPDEPEHAIPASTFDVPPIELEEHPDAAKAWIRLAPLMREARQVADVDRDALIAVCLEWARYLEATARVKRSGLVIQTKSGYPMVNPYISIATRALAACNKLWPELGLTPSSRSRIAAVEGAPPRDAWAEFDEDVPLVSTVGGPTDPQ